MAQLVADLAVEVDAIEHRVPDLGQPLASSLGTACRIMRHVVDVMIDELDTSMARTGRSATTRTPE